MNKTVHFPMRADALDPRNGGDTHSWFFFYKWRAGDTWVPAREGCMDAEAGDTLVFTMDGVMLAVSRVDNVVERNLAGEKELHFNSDEMTVPDELVQCDGVAGYGTTWKIAGPHLCDIKEGEEPQWLKSLLTRRSK